MSMVNKIKTPGTDVGGGGLQRVIADIPGLVLKAASDKAIGLGDVAAIIMAGDLLFGH